MNLHRTLRATAITGAMAATFLSSGAHSASIITDVDLNFPQVLVLYAFDAIEIDIDEAGLINAIDPGASDCTDQDYCVELLGEDLSGSPLDLTGGSGSIDAGLDDSDLVPLDGSVSVTINNAFGVRALGYTQYNASVTKTGTANDVFAGTPTVSTPTYDGLNLSTGSLSFDIDLNELSVSGVQSQSYQITVTGT
ncbi:hypothetical protein A3709_20125 [Halioglobus sp. HI00S01]|uniref:hypothetical protein n=1 Tax=Halioglobus sp. HI00S01 TaxID=1822214 RepID=UPI0007C2B99E|nr:hypothetical protein [Halioglobus sp. HI00S01]KZX57934.1 hypothetical protein A3709_20125 [Halioglobus sp. HI00S01]